MDLAPGELQILERDFKRLEHLRSRDLLECGPDLAWLHYWGLGTARDHLCPDHQLAVTRSTCLRAINVFALVVACALWLPFGVSAQIRTDSSLGRAAQTLTGPRYLIPQTLGRLAGNNLFYSFQTFNINTGESANFTTVTPTISNVVCRVTGGTPSLINGVLSLTAASGTPGFFFINPSGVTFGAGASIDVPGAFHVSTADYVKFADGNFYADATKTSTFSSAAPEAFGFLGTNRGAITVKDGATLSTGPLQPLSLTAGDIEIDNATVSTQGGDIRVVALGQRNQEIGLTGDLGPADGALNILNGGRILSQAIDAHDGGRVRVGAGSIDIDGGSSTTQTGIVSQAGSGGNAGSVTVTAANNLVLANGGQIASSTHSSGDAGTVTVNSGDITIDTLANADANPHFLAGIFSNGGEINVTATGNLSALDLGFIASGTTTASTGDAGSVNVSVAGILSLLNGSVITSSTSSSGNAGAVTVVARDITVDSQGYFFGNTGIDSEAQRGSSGRAGSVNVTAVGNLSLFHRGEISSSTFSSGDAGTVTVKAVNITLDGQGRSLGWGILSDANGLSDTGTNGKAGSVNVTATGNLSVLNGDYISSSSNGGPGAGDAGTVTVNAGSIIVDNRGYFGGTGIFSTAGGGGNGGDINVVSSGNLAVLNGGAISSSSYSTGNAGAVRVAAGTIVLNGQGFSNFPTGIFSDTNYSSGNAGSVSVTAGDGLYVANGASVSSSTYTAGSAGSVNVNAPVIVIDGQFNTDFLTGLLSVALGRGNAGDVNVASGNLLMIDGGVISSSTYSRGNAGALTVNAGIITIDSQGFGGTGIFSDTYGSGRAGSISVAASDRLSVLNRAAISSQANIGSSGNAGSVTVTATNAISLIGGGSISSSTHSSGAAGTITVSSNDITIDNAPATGYSYSTGIFSTADGSGNGGEINVTAAGNLSVVNTGIISSLATTRSTASGAGSVNVTVGGDLLLLNGGQINSGTASSSNAGNVTVNAGNILIDSQGYLYGTGIGADAVFHSSGNAGNVTVTATGDLSILDGAFISASAFPFSGGQTGSVTVSAMNSITLASGGEISIQNGANVPTPGSIAPTLLTVAAPEINVNSGGQITAASSGNVAASDVLVHFGNHLFLDSGSISTSANNGNGGSIDIQGSGGFVMHNSQVTTSVAGLTGNGGDINVRANGLAMNTGFIQANTAAENAAGGNVNINVQSLIPSGGSLVVGGQDPFAFQSGVFGFNVIQAAAPTGVSGAVQITSPALDISGALNGLNAKVIETGGLGRNPCRIEAGSSFVPAGRGGFLPSARDLLGPPSMESGKAAGDQSAVARVAPRLRVTETKCHQG